MWYGSLELSFRCVTISCNSYPYHDFFRPLTPKEKISQLGLLAVSYESSSLTTEDAIANVSNAQTSYYAIESTNDSDHSILSRGPPPTEYADWHKSVIIISCLLYCIYWFVWTYDQSDLEKILNLSNW